MSGKWSNKWNFWVDKRYKNLLTGRYCLINNNVKYLARMLQILTKNIVLTCETMPQKFGIKFMKLLLCICFLFRAFSCDARVGGASCVPFICFLNIKMYGPPFKHEFPVFYFTRCLKWFLKSALGNLKLKHQKALRCNFSKTIWNIEKHKKLVNSRLKGLSNEVSLPTPCYLKKI